MAPSPTGPLKNTAICIVYPITWSKSSWRPEKIAEWITSNGGKVLLRFSDEATHLVCAEKAWKGPHKEVQRAQDAAVVKNHNVKIVTPEWLEDALDSINGVRKPKSDQYLWEKVEKKEATIEKRVVKALEKEMRGGRSGGEHVGLMTEVLEQSTRQYVSEEQQKQLDKELERDRAKVIEKAKAVEIAKVQAREEERKQKREAAKKKVKNDFTEGHHIFRDDTGFEYDIKLTKVDTKKNRNERYELTLQIYESDSIPHTYGTNMHFAGTGHPQSNDIIAVLGCTLLAAYRTFRIAFKEQTRVEWDDRVTHAIERVNREKRARGQGTGSPVVEDGRGCAVSDEEMQRVLEMSETAEFSKKPFVYHPPMYGPRGKLQVPGEDLIEAMSKLQRKRNEEGEARKAAEQDGGANSGVVEDGEEVREQPEPSAPQEHRSIDQREPSPAGARQTDTSQIHEQEQPPNVSSDLDESLAESRGGSLAPKRSGASTACSEATALAENIVDHEHPPARDAPSDFDQFLAEGAGVHAEALLMNQYHGVSIDGLDTSYLDDFDSSEQHPETATQTGVDNVSQNFAGGSTKTETETEAPPNEDFMQDFTQDTDFDATQAARAVRNELDAEIAGLASDADGTEMAGSAVVRGRDNVRQKRKTPPVDYELEGADDGPRGGKSPRFGGEESKESGTSPVLGGESGAAEFDEVSEQFVQDMAEAAKPGGQGVEISNRREYEAARLEQ